MGKVLTKTMWNLSQFSDVDFAIKDMIFFYPWEALILFPQFIWMVPNVVGF